MQRSTKEPFIFGGVLENHPNKSVVTLHMRHQLMTVKVVCSDDHTLCFDEKNFNPGIEKIDTELRALNGLISFTFEPYEIGLTKAEAFSWDELLPQVKYVLALRLQILDY